MSHGLFVIYAALLFAFLVTGVVPNCNENSNNTVHVARMCHNSNVTGTRVFIDADEAGSTTLASGVRCTCTVTTRVGKKMEVKLSFNGTLNQICGTTIEFTGQGLSNGTESHSCNDATFNVTTNTNRTMDLELRKTQAPYLSTYCVSLELLDVNITEESGQREQSTPLITVICTDSNVAQTTTAPIRTTTSQTTTTLTTTATPTTTTSSPTTITVLTDTSVSSPDQTLLVIFAVVVCICVSALVALCACSKKIEDNKIEREKREFKRDKFGRSIHVTK